MTKSVFARFSSATGIKAFGFAKTSKSRFEQLFWYCLIVCGTVLTCVDIRSTISSYISFSTGTKIILFDNTTLDLGEPTLCVRVPIPQLVHMHDGELDRIFKDINSSDSLSSVVLDDSNSLDTTLIALLAHLVSDTILAEEGSLGENLTSNGTAELVLPHFVYTFTEAPKVNRYLSQLNISLRDVAGVVGAYLCRRIKLHINLYDYGGDEPMRKLKDNICTPKLIVFLDVIVAGLSQFCVKLPSRFFNFKNSFDYARIKWFTNESIPPLAEVGDFDTLDFSGGSALLHSSTNILWIPKFLGYSVSVNILNIYKRISSLKSPCSSQLKSQCQLRCRYNFIVTQCGCKALFDDSNVNSDICGSYSEVLGESMWIPGFNLTNPLCRQIKVKSNPDTSCESNCHSPCEYKILSFFYMLTKPPTDFGYTRLAVFVDRFSYHQVEEIELMSTKQFLGSLGGNLSLYVGASFIVVIHIFVFWLVELAEWRLWKSSITLSIGANSINKGNGVQ